MAGCFPSEPEPRRFPGDRESIVASPSGSDVDAASIDPDVRRINGILTKCLSRAFKALPDLGPTGVTSGEVADRMEKIRRLPFLPALKTVLKTGVEQRKEKRAIARTALRSDAYRTELAVLSMLGVSLNDIHKAAQRAWTDMTLLEGLASASNAASSRGFFLARSTGQALIAPVLFYPAADGASPIGDRSAAVNAVFEGDATLAALIYLASASGDPSRTAMRDVASAAAEVLATERSSIETFFDFPVVEGTLFACQLFAKGGWTALNRALIEPPETTAQILFPDRYTAGERPLLPRPLEESAGSFVSLYERDFGAFDLKVLLRDLGLEPADSRRLVAAWGGGKLHVWVRNRNLAVGISLVQRRGHDDLCRSMTDWLRGLIPVETLPRRRHESVAVREYGREGVVKCEGPNVLVGLAPDVSIARKLLGP